MPFNKFGYLGNEINNITKNAYESYSDLFDIFFKLNSYVQGAKFKYIIHRGNIQENLVATILIKVLDSLQSAIILAFRGLDSDAKVILRAAIESFIILKAISKDEIIAKEYLDSEKVEALKLMNIIFNDQNKVFSESLKSHVNKSDIASLKDEIDSKKLHEIKVQDMARKGETLILYDYAYRLLCSEVHTSVKSLDKYLKADGDLGVEVIECAPQFNDIPKILLTAIIVIFDTIECINVVFKVESNEILSGFETRFEELLEKYKPNFEV